jgi:hypothetical protein
MTITVVMVIDRDANVACAPVQTLPRLLLLLPALV